ncbi:MAG: hypothetical protein K2O88_02545 [Paramuribaculum sp.]|nr:hypothetical protein [Paramuribaculum sp.]
MHIATWILITLFTIAGTLALGAAITNARWLFGSANARMLTARISRRTSRIIYGIAGMSILAMAVYLALNIPYHP